MDGRADPAAADGGGISARRGLRIGFPVLFPGASDAFSEDPLFYPAFRAAVPGGREGSCAAVSVAFRGADRRNDGAAYTAARRARDGGRYDRGNGSGACRAAFRRCGAVPSAIDPKIAHGTSETRAAHADRRTACRTHLSARRVDRQRESPEGAGFRIAGAADRRAGRPTDMADPVCKTFGKRHRVRRTTGFGYIAAIRKRGG